MRKGILLILLGPSGSGKGTVLKEILNNFENMHLSISCTTRKPREGEKNGINYFFKTKNEFEEMIEKGYFLEYKKVYDNYYGTPKQVVEEMIEKGIDVILEIDTQGALEIIKNKKDVVSIFITPPSKEILFQRLENRNTESIDEIRKRMKWSNEEYKIIDKFEYIVINDNLDKCVSEIKEIINVEKLKTKRNIELINKFKE